MESTLIAVLAGLVAALLIALLVLALAWRSATRRANGTNEAEVGGKLEEVMQLQAELTGRVKAMGEAFGSRQAELSRGLLERLDGLGHRIGQSMGETTRTTQESLSKLAERLAVIDTAQRNITDLSSRMVELQHILADKQTRGAFGQGRMEAIIGDGLASGAYEFQATLSNGKRPDCLVRLPNGAPSLVIDAKFPLEAWNAIRAAEGPEQVKAAQSRFRRDIQGHVKAIREKYFIPGETQDTAFMFVPSESIFAELHEGFDDVVQEAYRHRVVIVSPSLLMLSIQVVQAVLKDAKMREQAHLIRDEVVEMMGDVRRLDDRVRALKTHFDQGAKDIDLILVSTRKITGRGERISESDLGSSDLASGDLGSIDPLPSPLAPIFSSGGETPSRE